MFQLLQCGANTYYLKCFSNIGVYDLGDGTCVLIDAGDHKKSVSDLNKAIADTDGLGAAYMIGPSYFLKLKDNGADFNKLWKMNIEPLLKEYLRGFRKSAEILEKFSKAYFNANESQTTDTPKLIDED